MFTVREIPRLKLSPPEGSFRDGKYADLVQVEICSRVQFTGWPKPYKGLREALP